MALGRWYTTTVALVRAHRGCVCLRRPWPLLPCEPATRARRPVESMRPAKVVDAAHGELVSQRDNLQVQRCAGANEKGERVNHVLGALIDTPSMARHRGTEVGAGDAILQASFGCTTAHAAPTTKIVIAHTAIATVQSTPRSTAQGRTRQEGDNSPCNEPTPQCSQP